MVNMYRAHHCRTRFGSQDVEKVHSVVARSTFSNQNVQNTSASDDFSNEHAKSTRASDHFTDDPMLKKCTPLWCEAHLEVKSDKNSVVSQF